MPKIDDPTRTADQPAAPDAGRAYLFVVQGTSSSMHLLPYNGAVMFGRDPKADIRLLNTAASREHARIVIASGQAQIIDLESRNGTCVNGARLDGARPLCSGDVVTLGDAVVVMRRARPAKSGPIVDLPEIDLAADRGRDRALAASRSADDGDRRPARRRTRAP